LTKAEKFAGKFDVFRLKHFMLATGRDVNACLQVKTRSLRDTSAFGPDLQKSDRVTLFDPLASIRRKLPSIRRILLNLDDDHVRLRAKLPCLIAIVSRFARDFLAQTRSRHASCETSLHRRDQVVIDASRSLLAVFVGTF
jgi:hypothetical protein